jgi:hypothetical protein
MGLSVRVSGVHYFVHAYKMIAELKYIFCRDFVLFILYDV